MVKSWIFLLGLSAIIISSCEDIPEVVYNQIPVEINLSATSSALEKMNIDFEKIMINNQLNTLDTCSTAYAGVIDMVQWTTDKKMIGEFTVSYDSIQRIEFFLGDANQMEINGQVISLPLKDGVGPSIIIPVKRYIQDQTQVELNLELNLDQSVVMLGPDSYALDPKLVLKN